tara:strand:+ start:951 stop:1208 length:258 start_codon:yes stop_codon:yes gene_type:complete
MKEIIMNKNRTTTTGNRYSATRFEVTMVCEYTRVVSLLAKNESEAKLLAENRIRATSVSRFRDSKNTSINGSLGDIHFIEAREEK